MKGVALSDIHLGYRSFAALNDEGRNQREVDVENAWLNACREIADLKPDLVTIAGDIFHGPRVSMHAVRAWRIGVRTLVDSGAHVVAILGNHDAGRSSETLSPVVIPEDIDRFHVVTRPSRLNLNLTTVNAQAGIVPLSVSIVCLPFVRGGPDSEEVYDLSPDPKATVNMILMHAAVRTTAEGVDPLPHYYGNSGSLDVGVLSEHMDVIHCGDYHRFHRLHPERLAFYSGALERTTSNIWGEEGPFGFVTYDTRSGILEFVKTDVRAMWDDIAGAGQSGGVTNVECLNADFALAADDESYRDATVRWTIPDFPCASRDLIDWGLVRAMKAHCLHFELKLQYLEAVKPEGQVSNRRGASIQERAELFFEDDDREVRSAAFAYLGLEIPEAWNLEADVDNAYAG